MARRRVVRRLGTDFSLGGEQAEADPLLQLGFYESGDFLAVESKLDPRCFVIGRTGAGKSAALQRLEEEDPEHVIRINPEDLSLPYITDLRALRYLDELDVHLSLFFIALWKHVLLVELIKHRYKVDSPEAKQNFFQALRDRVRRDPGKRAALQYLDEFEGRFWAETDERVREITESFQKRIDAAAKADFGIPQVGRLGVQGAVEGEFSSETRAEQAERFQRIVNDTQLGRLNKMLTVLNEDILDSPQHFTYVVIDDLDREWVDERLANELIRCLFRTVLDLKRVKNLKVLVALRTNIFQELPFSDRGGGQEEKFRALILPIRWRREDLKRLLDERTRVAAELGNIEGLTGVRDLIPRANRTRGDPLNFILGRTLLRPRDAIAFMNEALLIGAGKPALAWEDLHSAERPYSEKRLLALRDEWKLTYPDIQRVFEVFRGAPAALSRNQLTSRMDDTVALMADAEFRGVRWMTEMASSILNPPSTDTDWVEQYHSLIQLVFNIGFMGLGRSQGGPFTYSHDDPDLADRVADLETRNWFSVHPAFQAALEIQEPRRSEGTTSSETEPSP